MEIWYLRRSDSRTRSKTRGLSAMNPAASTIFPTRSISDPTLHVVPEVEDQMCRISRPRWPWHWPKASYPSVWKSVVYILSHIPWGMRRSAFHHIWRRIHKCTSSRSSGKICLRNTQKQIGPTKLPIIPAHTLTLNRCWWDSDAQREGFHSATCVSCVC